MNNRRAWSFLTIDGVRQYGGNKGYSDNPTSVYRYDSDVANHLRVRIGDIAVIRSRENIIGIAEIEKIYEGSAQKIRLRCPTCGVTNIKQRPTMEPAWACKNKHYFDEPISEPVIVKTFEAYYGSNFHNCGDGLNIINLQNAVLRPSDQMSIKEIDLEKIEKWLFGNTGSRKIIEKFAATISIDSIADEHKPDSFTSIIEERRRVLREINVRRGQTKFRKRLIERYSGVCQVTKCNFSGLLEAAHIRPYSASNENSVTNGLLLRSDIHVLYDLSLLGINPRTMRIILHPATFSAGYHSFDGTLLFLNNTEGPDYSALSERWDFFELSFSKIYI